MGIDTSKIMDVAIIGILAYAALKIIPPLVGIKDTLGTIGGLLPGAPTQAAGATVTELSDIFGQIETMTPAQAEATAGVLETEAALPFVETLTGLATAAIPGGGIVGAFMPTAGEMAASRTQQIIAKAARSKPGRSLAQVQRDITMTEAHLEKTIYAPGATPEYIAGRQEAILERVAKYGYGGR